MREPIKLLPVRTWRTYTGGKMLEALHGNQNGTDSQFPEEWIMSVVTARNAGRGNMPNEGIPHEGMSILENGQTLKELLESDPSLMGRTFQLGILIKLIDSAERLTIQVHPDKHFAEIMFQSEYGETECWHILGGRVIDGKPPCIYLGFHPGVTRERWNNIFDAQDIPQMLDCLNCFAVKTGDAYLIEGGVPHAIGSGCFLVEIQEPTGTMNGPEISAGSQFFIPSDTLLEFTGFLRMIRCYGPAPKKRGCHSI